MLRLSGFFSIALLLTSGQASSQSTSAETEAQMRAEWFKTCARDWDIGTHMTKKEWDRVCRRVTDERVKFRVEQKRKDNQEK